MSLRTKTMLTVAATLLIATGLSSLAAGAVLLARFRALEDQETAEAVERAVRSLDRDITALDRVAGDWAPWTETYEFASHRDQAYIDANLASETLMNLRVDVMLIVDRADTIVHGVSVDRQARQARQPSPDLITALRSYRQLFHHAHADSHVTGVVTTPDGLLIVASQPILHDDFSGPIGGVLVLGRFLRADDIERIGQQVLTPVSLEPYNAATAAPARGATPITLPSGQPGFTRIVGHDRVAGATFVPDLRGQPIATLSVTVSRHILRHGIATVWLVIGLLVASGGALLVAIHQGMTRLVVARVQQLGRELAEISTTGDRTARVTVTPSRRPDELDALAGEINAALEALDGAQAMALQRARLRALATESSNAMEAERRRIAGELHDHVGQSLAVARLLLGTAQETADAAARAQITEARTHLEDAIGWTRTLTGELCPPVLREVGLAAAIRWFGSQLAARHDLAVEVVDMRPSEDLPQQMRSMLYSMLRELLVNVLKHARATRVTVELDATGEAVLASVQDNGVGAHLPADALGDGSHGFGLFSIGERLQHLGGDMQVSFPAEGGTRVVLCLPRMALQPQEDA